METLALLSPTLSTFLLMFFFIYLLAFFTVFRNWGPKQRPEASSCVISLFHGTPAVIMAASAVIQTQAPSPSAFASPNTDLYNTVLEYSIAYFLMDLLHYTVFFPTDFLFILHHVATLYVFVTCRYVVGRGGFALLVLLLLAEITSACQNAWSLSGLRRDVSPAAARVYETLSFPFYAFYSVVRGVLGPLFVCEMWVFYLSGQANGMVGVPKWAWVSWMVVIVAAILVSIVWVLGHWALWYKGRNYKVMKKVA